MKSIDITTTQNVTIEYELAGMRERVLAYLLDWLILTMGYYGFVLLLNLLFDNRLFSGLSKVTLIWLSPLAIFFLYHILFEIWNGGQTPGKKAMKIKVVRLDGKDPEWGDVVLRAVLHVVDSLASAGVIGLLLIKSTSKSQRLGDMAAHTTVIRLFSSQYHFRLEDILRISSLDTYTPIHPEVRNLSERDMIFIKNALTRYQQHPNNAHYNAVVDISRHVAPLINRSNYGHDPVEFLRTLLRDYIVLTR
ncbi:MAG TPA: RDD family protein [Saprospiraceae bacterium]|nr:RDD family protein [Saprospiraceae bacterium]